MIERLHDLLAVQAGLRPHATALWWQDQATDYATLQARASSLARRLASAGAPGERIAVLAWNCPEYIELIYAVPASGRILVPLNARLAPAELIWQLRNSGASTLFADPHLLQPLIAHEDFPSGIEVIGLDHNFQSWRAGLSAHLPATGLDDAVWILHTSGTTGRPKGAVLTHRSFLEGLRSAAMGRPVEADDVYLYPFPLFHVAAHNVLLQHQHGASVVLHPSFDAAATLEACRHLGVNTLSLAPTMIAMLLDHPQFDPADLAGVRTIGYGASAMPQTLLRRLLNDTGVGLCQSYGMTELSGSIAFLTPADHRLAASDRPELLESVGRPLPTTRVRLEGVEGDPCTNGGDGEILVTAGQCMQQYWEDAAGSASALDGGWLHTGDIGRFDKDGYLYIIDRKKDMIISGGENVASREVEEVMRRHSAVKDCAVIGLPHPRWGETICAVLQLEGDPGDAELETHCRQFLAGYKTPRLWLRVPALPVNAAGKIDKARLRSEEFLRSHGVL